MIDRGRPDTDISRPEVVKIFRPIVRRTFSVFGVFKGITSCLVMLRDNKMNKNGPRDRPFATPYLKLILSSKKSFQEALKGSFWRKNVT